MATADKTVRNTALRIIENLPDHATWDDVLHALYVRGKIDRGLADADAGRTTSHDALKDALLRDQDFSR